MTILLMIVGSALLLITCLPLVTFLRLARVLSEVRALRLRVAALEDELRTVRAPSQTVTPPLPGIDRATAAAEPAPAPPVEQEITAADIVVIEADTAALAGTAPSVSEAEVRTGAHPPPLAPPAGPVRPAAATSRTDQADALEAAIGGRLLLYVGTLVVVLGVAYFLKYAFDREWITEGMRVALGGIAGLALVTGGLRLAGRGYAVYGQILAGGGLAALYLSVYAAFGFYGLIARSTALVLLLAVTVAAALLADRHRSQGMALMAVGGGYLTPFLVGGREDAQIALFSYVALLVGGTMYLAHRRQWPWLHVLAYACTLLVTAAWADAHYTSAKYLRTELFLTLFCVMFLMILRSQRGARSEAAAGARLVLWTAPAAYHAASLAVLAPHGIALLVYLIAFSLVGVVTGIRTKNSNLRLLLWAAAWLPLIGWLDAHHARTWVWPGLVTLAAVFTLHLAAQLDRTFRHESPLDRTDLLLLHLNGLGALGGVYVLLAGRSLSQVLVLGAILAAIHLGLATRWRTRDESASLNALAVGFTLVAALVAIELDGTWLTAAWAAEGAAIMAIGVQLDRRWFRLAGAVLLGIAAARWLVLSVPGVPVNFRLVLNPTFLLGSWIIVLTYAVAWWHRHRAHERYGSSVAGLLVFASVLTVIMLSAENASYWNLQGNTLSDATFAEGLALSVIWALYAGVLIAVGFRLHYRPVRYTAIALFALTIAKVFLFDLSGLQGIYRVLGLMVVGTVLLIVSFLYQRKRQADAATEGPPVSS